MRAFADIIDLINRTIGRAVMWFALALVLLQFCILVLRYAFGIGWLFGQESIIYLHGFLFMIAAAYTLLIDGHVRVDIFYREAKPRKKAIINLFGVVAFLLPVCLLILYYSWGYVLESWRIFEGSPETSGVPFRYVQKTAIIIFTVLMILQGISIALRSLLAIGGDVLELEKLTNGEQRPERSEDVTGTIA